MTNILKVYTFNKEKNVLAPFPNPVEQLVIGEYQYSAVRMGSAPTITAKAKHRLCLDDYWTDEVCVEFNGEKYYVDGTPSSSKNNEDTRYVHDITFKSERSVLNGIFFIDAVYNDPNDPNPQLTDRYVSNNTNVVFMGDIYEFVGRLNSALRYAGLGGLKNTEGYYVVVDAGITSEIKAMSFEDKYFSEVLQEIFNTYKLPYYFKGKEIHIGYTSNVLTETFKYGFENELLSIEKQNTNNGYTNRATGVGSSENLPFYYPNTSAQNSTFPHFLSTNKGETDDKKLSISNTRRFGSRLPATQVDSEVKNSDCLIYHIAQQASISNFELFASYYAEEGKPISWTFPFSQDATTPTPIMLFPSSLDFFGEESNKKGHNGSFSGYRGETQLTDPKKRERTLWGCFVANQDGSTLLYIDVSFVSNQFKIDGLYRSYSTPVLLSVEMFKGEILLGGIEPTDAIATPNQIKSSTFTSGGLTVTRLCIELDNLKSGTIYNMRLNIRKNVNSENEYDYEKNPDDYLFYKGWSVGNVEAHWSKVVDSVYTKVTLSEYGIKLLDTSRLQDGDMITRRVNENAGTVVPNATVLMPSIYRQSGGTERFYNAKNEGWTTKEKHLYQASDDGTMYRFEHIYSKNNPHESKNTYDDIKPTIKGMVNVEGKRMDMFLDIAFDTGDDDALTAIDGETSAEYNHPYFFVKLAKTSGREDKYGFNLFDQACESGKEMTISMTSGSCGACNFPIMVDENTGKNTVQVNADGTLKRDIDGRVLFGAAQDVQNDTRYNEVWLCLKKEDSTYGQLMPNASQNLAPKAREDTFVYTNIEMPLAYILDAEDRLSKAIVKDMWENNSEKFNFSIAFSRIYFAEHPDIAKQIDENARIPIEYNGKTIYQYVSSYTYSVTNNNSLPEVKVELSGNLSVNQNSLQRAIGEVKGDFINILGNYDTLNAMTPYFMRKDVRDTALARMTFLQGIEIGRYTSGNFGTGGIFGVYSDGTSYIEADYAFIKRKAVFTNLTIQELRHVGGQLIISPAAAEISRVVENEDSYRCFFNTTGGQTGTQIYNQFVIGDCARCQSFNEAWEGDEYTMKTGQNRYYWRLVVGVGNGYVDLSKNDCDRNSDIPQANDKICQLGNRTDITRQNAQILSAFGADAPSRKMYQGVTCWEYEYNQDGNIVKDEDGNLVGHPSYSLAGKEVSADFYNTETQRMKTVTYGDFYYGDKEGNSYVSWDTDKKELSIKGKLEIASTVGDTGKTLEEYIKEQSSDIDMTEINNLINGIKEDLQNQIDGAIETWFAEGVPTLTNYPASQWTDNEIKNIHIGDLYYDKTTGKAYRFQMDGNMYVWQVITDTDIQAALEAANNAQVTADGKMKVFNHQPKTSEEYNVGDLWVNATYGTQYKDDILHAIIGKKAGEPFSINHWRLASDYNKLAEEAKIAIDELRSYIDGAFADGIIDEQELSTLNAYKKQVQTVFENVKANYNKIYSNELLTGEVKTTLKTAYDDFVAKKDNLINIIDNAINDRTVDDEEINNVNTAYDAFNKAYGTYVSAITDATLYIQKKLVNDSLEDYKYLKEAFARGQNSSIEGGLMMSTLIELGYVDKDGVRHTKSGLSGIYQKNTDIALWFGGDMIDGQIAANTTNPDRARALFRMDGTGYLADGAITWNNDGSGYVAKGNLKWDSSGNVVLGSGIKVNINGNSNLLTNTLTDILNYMNSLHSWLTPVDRDGNELAYQEATEANVYALKAKSNFYATGGVSALGMGNMGSGGGSGSGGLIETVYGYNSLGDTFNDTNLSDTFNAYTISKIAQRLSVIEKGALTSVSWNNITGKPTSLNGYGIILQESDIPNLSWGKIDDTPSTIAGYGITDVYTKSEADNKYAKIASPNNLVHLSKEITMIPSGYNNILWLNYRTCGGLNGNISMYIFGNGNAAAANIKAASFIKDGGTYSQFLMADGSVKNLGDITSAYVSYIGLSGNNLTWTKNGVSNAITIPYATSANKLYTARTIWGKSFDGTANISGNMTGVGTINTSAAPIDTIYANNWFRSVGDTGWYNQTYGGGWYMSDSTWIRAWGNKSIYTGGSINAVGGMITNSAFIQTGDATLKIYTGKITDAVSDGNICLQTSIDNTDGQTNNYPTMYQSRCNLVLQPRGGQVYIGTNPNGGNASYKLNVTGGIWTDSLTIDGIRLSYDSVNNALKITGNAYATGGVSALGMSPDTSAVDVYINSLSAKKVDIRSGALTFLDNNTMPWIIPPMSYDFYIGNKANESYICFIEDITFGTDYDMYNSRYYITNQGEASFKSLSTPTLNLNGAKITYSSNEIYVTIGTAKYKLNKTLV